MKCRTWIPVAVVCALVSAVSVQGVQTAPPAQTLLDAAVTRAQAENKTVWVEFGASWCSWCRQLEKFLHDPSVSKVIDRHFIILPLVVLESADKKALENAGGDVLMKTMGGANSGLPFYAFINGSGSRIANSMAMPDGGNIGMPATPEEHKAFMKVLEVAAPRMTAGERAVLAAYLDRFIASRDAR